MAIVERENQQISENISKEKEILYDVYPDMRREIDYKTRHIKFEVSLPGVKKETIELKVLPKWFHLTGKRGHIMYNANQNFGKEIIPEHTTARYEDGLLTITAEIPDPYAKAKEITL